MSTRKEFVQKVLSRKPDSTRDEIKALMKQRRESVGPFDDDATTEVDQPKAPSGASATFGFDPTAPEPPPVPSVFDKFGEVSERDLFADPRALEAGLIGAGRTASFGLAEKITPTVSAAVKAPFSPKTFGELKEEEEKELGEFVAEREQEFPVATKIGELAGFVKGAPKAIFSGVGKLTANITAKNAPKLVQSLVKTVKGAIETGVGLGISEGVRGFVGEPGEEVSVERGIEEGVRATKTGAIVGGVFGLGTEVLSSALPKVANKILTSKIKPLKEFREQGFDAANIPKHKLGGTLKSTAKKAEAKINDLGKQLQTELKRDPTARVNVQQAIRDVEREIRSKPGEFGLNQEQLLTWLKRYERNISNIEGIDPKSVDLLTVNGFRRQLGRDGSFNVIQATPDITAGQTIANKLYGRIRQAIDDAVPDKPKLKAINQALHEIIPIEGAVNHAIQRTATNNMFSLPEYILSATGVLGTLGGGIVGGAPGATVGAGTTLGLLGARRGLTSAPAAATFTAVGETARRVSERTPSALLGGLGRKLRPEEEE